MPDAPAIRAMKRNDEPKRLFLKFRRWNQRPERMAASGTEGESAPIGLGSHVRLCLGPHTVFARIDAINEDASFTGRVMLVLRAPGYSAPPLAAGERLYFWKQNVFTFSTPAGINQSNEPRKAD